MWRSGVVTVMGGIVATMVILLMGATTGGATIVPTTGLIIEAIMATHMAATTVCMATRMVATTTDIIEGTEKDACRNVWEWRRQQYVAFTPDSIRM